MSEPSPHPPLPPHLSGAALEALAAGDSADAAAAQHLASCAQCRAAVAAMKAENQLFAAELAAPAVQEVSMSAAAVSRSANVTKLPPQSHKPLVFYVVAASIMLVAALALIYCGKQPDKPDGGTNPQVAEGPKTPPEKIADDKEKPAEAKPPEEEATYEGSSAGQWVAQLKKELAENKQLSPLGQKAVHALIELGREALPQVLDLARTPGDANIDTADTIVCEMRLEKADLQLLADGLKAKDYGTRLAAVNLVGGYASSHPELAQQSKVLLDPMLHDRDKAVVEATRKKLSSLEAAQKWLENGENNAAKSFEALKQRLDSLTPAQKIDELNRFCAKFGDSIVAARARVMLNQLKQEQQPDATDNLEQARKAEELYDTLLRQAKSQLVNGNYADAQMRAERALQVKPNDFHARELIETIKREIHTNGKLENSTADAQKEAEADNAFDALYARIPHMASQNEEVSALRDILKRYPNSKAATRAHQLLEQINQAQTNLRDQQKQLEVMKDELAELEKQKAQAADPAVIANLETRLQTKKQVLQALLEKMGAGATPPGNTSKLETIPPQQPEQKELDQLKQDIEELRGHTPKAAPEVKKQEPTKKDEF